ncbi:MAG: pilus assembly protein TadG-related protein [Actinomycetota bacterium]
MSRRASKSERGSVPLWFLGLAVCLLMLGALSAELWRVIGERQELVALADGAAVAAAGIIDLDHYRTTGEALVDPSEASARALQVIATSSGADDLTGAPAIVVAADGSSVSVELRREVRFGLLRVLSFQEDRFVVTAVAVAYPYSP